MSLRLSNQLCFPLYAAARAMQQAYRPLLDPLGLTYPQYLVMLVLWERDAQAVGALGERLHLDSGTLTPLLKRLEGAGLVHRRRSGTDQRVVTITLSPAGDALRHAAATVPEALLGSFPAESSLDLPALKSTLDQLFRALESR